MRSLFLIVFPMLCQLTILQVLQAQFNTRVQHLCRILSHKPIITLYFRWLHVKVLLINFTVCSTSTSEKKFLFLCFAINCSLFCYQYTLKIYRLQSPNPKTFYMTSQLHFYIAISVQKSCIIKIHCALLSGVQTLDTCYRFVD